MARTIGAGSFISGFGGNFGYVDREHDLVIVPRWMRDLAGVVTRTLAALQARSYLHLLQFDNTSQCTPH